MQMQWNRWQGNIIEVEILQVDIFQHFGLTGINAQVLYKETMDKNISRQEFLFQLTTKLGAEYQESREEN